MARYFDTDVNRSVVNKVQPGDFYALNMGFQTERQDARGLLEAIHAGHSWTAPHRKVQHDRGGGKFSTFRCRENVIHVTALALDFDTEDDRSTLATLLADPFIRQYAAIIHTTASHTDEKPRARVVFPLSGPVDVATGEAGQLALLSLYPHADQSTKDASRLYFGAKGCAYIFTDGVLPVDVLQREIDAYQAKQDTIRIEREAQRQTRTATIVANADGAGRAARYIRGTLYRVLADVSGAVEGTRHNILRDAAVRLGSLSAAEWLDDVARRELDYVADDLATAAAVWANGDDREIERIIRDGLAYGGARPAWEPEWSRANAFDPLAASFFAAAGPQLDGRQRDIFAGVLPGPALTVDLPVGKYLADVLTADQVPDRAILAANTGSGKTEFSLTLPGPVLLVTSTTVALEQTLTRHRAAGLPVSAYYKSEKSAKPGDDLVVTTYESFRRVLPKVDVAATTLVIDEIHNLAASGAPGFRRSPLETVLDAIEGGAWKRVLLMTGTPMPMSHPALRGFTSVNVRSVVRNQQAQRVVWRAIGLDGKKRGRKMEALLGLIDTEQTHLIFLNSKGKQLDSLAAGLRERGFTKDEIVVLNSDTKHDAAGQSIIDTEHIPDGARVLIVTSVFVEASNLRDRFDAIHLYSPIHPLLAQQLVNRLRTDAAGVVYWYNAGEGLASKVNTAAIQAAHLRRAGAIVAHLNTVPIVDPDDRSESAILARRELHTYSTEARELVRIDEDDDGRQFWNLSYIGVDHTTFEDVASFTHNNPAAWQKILEPFGWTWLDDMETIVTTKPSNARVEAVAEMGEARQAAFAARVEQIESWGESYTVAQLKTDTTADTMTRAIQHVLTIKNALAGHRPLSQDGHLLAFEEACSLAVTAGDNRRRVARTARRLKIQQLRGQGGLTDQLYEAFSIGERLTSAEVLQRIMEVFATSPLMTGLAIGRHRWRHSLKATEARAVELLGDLFEIHRTTQRTDDAVVNVYAIDGVIPADIESVFTKLQTDIENSQSLVNTKPVKVASDSAAFVPDATPPAKTDDGGDILDWFLATGARRPARAVAW